MLSETITDHRIETVPEDRYLVRVKRVLTIGFIENTLRLSNENGHGFGIALF